MEVFTLNEEIFNEIWENGIVVLDTCTLDFIERCEVSNAKKLMDIFLLIHDRVFIPAHVKNFEMKNYFDLGKAKTSMVDKLLSLKNEIVELSNVTVLSPKEKKQKAISKLQKFSNQLSKYDFQILSKRLRSVQKLNIDQIIAFLTSSECSDLIEEYDEFLNSGTVKDFYGMIMSNVFEQFSNEKMIDLASEGEERRKKNIPPACGDSNKTQNAFGDFIIWKEILNNILNTKYKKTIFITEDKKKGSNWFDATGANIHPILRHEVQKTCGYDALYISDLKSFVELSRNFVNENIEELIDYIRKNSIEVVDVIQKYLLDEQYDILAEKTWEAITQKCDVDYSLPDPSADIEIVEFQYTIYDKVIADIQLNVEFDTESFIRYGGDDWSDSSHVVATVNLQILIEINQGYYREDLYSLDLENMEMEIINIDIDAEAPFGMDESDKDEDCFEDYEGDDEDYECEVYD